MAKAAETTPDQLPDAETARRLLRMMVLIRRFEERTEEQYTRARIGGYCHLAIGEEAANVGAIDALEDGDYLFASYRDHGTALAVGSPPAAGDGGAVRQGDRRGPRLRRLDAPARRRAPLPRRLGHRRRPPADRRRRRAGARLHATQPGRRAVPVRRRRDQHRRLPRGAEPGRRLGPARSSSRSSTTCTAWARRSSRPRPSPSCTSAPAPTACTASASTATTCWRCARPPAGCSTRAREERQPALLETITYRFRGHSVADAGKVYRTTGGDRAWRERDPITRFGLCRASRDCSRRTRSRRLRKEVAAEVKEAIRRGRARRRRPTWTRCTTTSTATSTGASSSRACRPAAPFGERERGRDRGRRDLPRGAAPGARRGAGARRARLPDGRGDRRFEGSYKVTAGL